MNIYNKDNTPRFIDLPLDTSISIGDLYTRLESIRKDCHYDLNDYCFKISKENSDIAFKLYQYVIEQNNIQDWFYQISSLLNGIYQSENGFSREVFFKEIDKLKLINENLAYFILARIKYDSKEEIEQIHVSLLNDESLSIETISQLPIFYRNLIENKNTSVEIIEQSFSHLADLFDKGDNLLKENVFNNTYLIKGFEGKKYKLLIEHFLVNTPTFYKQLNMFFINFSNPDYFFDLYIKVLKVFYTEQRIMDIEDFYSPFNHFWNESREKTESILLELLTHDNSYLRIGAVKLIRHSYEGIINTIDLLKLDTETKQLRALEVMVRESYFNIAQLLPLILQFKKSPYPKVIKYLQKKLSELVFDSYQSYLYNLLEEEIGKDADFMKPIKETLDKYNKIENTKNKYNDLNPYENERDWMQLYYRLDEEKRRRMMEKASECSIFSFLAKKSIIVRGKGWKVGEKSEISLLGHFEHMFTIDSRMYKDSDLFDAQYAEFNFESEF